MTYLRWCLGGLLLMAMACQTKPKQETETPATSGTQAHEDSLLALSTRPGPDAPRSAADRLVRALYFEHNTKENPLRETKDRSVIDQFFVKPTADLIWNDAQKAQKINRTKTNLLFNAPDASVKKTWVEPAAVGGSKSVVYVTFLNNNKPEDIRIELDQITGNRWRITDIIYPDKKRLTELLK